MADKLLPGVRIDVVLPLAAYGLGCGVSLPDDGIAAVDGGLHGLHAHQEAAVRRVAGVVFRHNALDRLVGGDRIRGDIGRNSIHRSDGHNQVEGRQLPDGAAGRANPFQPLLQLEVGVRDFSDVGVFRVEHDSRGVEARRHVRAVNLNRDLTLSVDGVCDGGELRVHHISGRLRQGLGRGALRDGSLSDGGPRVVHLAAPGKDFCNQRGPRQTLVAAIFVNSGRLDRHFVSSFFGLV